MRFLCYSDVLCILIRMEIQGQVLNASFLLAFCKFQIKKTYFLVSAYAIIIILDLTIDFRSTVVKRVFFQSM